MWQRLEQFRWCDNDKNISDDVQTNSETVVTMIRTCRWCNYDSNLSRIVQTTSEPVVITFLNDFRWYMTAIWNFRWCDYDSYIAEPGLTTIRTFPVVLRKIPDKLWLRFKLFRCCSDKFGLIRLQFKLFRGVSEKFRTCCAYNTNLFGVVTTIRIFPAMFKQISECCDYVDNISGDELIPYLV